MCGQYQFSADEYKEIRQIVRDAQRRSEEMNSISQWQEIFAPRRWHRCWFHAGEDRG